MSSKPNIPVKSSGDTFSADELNTIVDFFENKPDADELIPGPEGPQGIQGPEGPKGVDGQSAYSIAVENGYVGTEEEWIESLSPVRYMDGDIFDGDGETPETKTTIKDGSIEEVKLSEGVQTKLNIKEADYIIEKVGATVYAHPTGSLTAYSGTDAYTVIQAAIDELTPAGEQGAGGGKISVGKGEFVLTNELTIIGWEAGSGNPQSQLQIIGSGLSTKFVQTTSGKNGIVVKNRASIVLDGFRMNIGANAKSGILLDDTGEDSECSVFGAVIDNILIISNSNSAPAFHAKNFFDLSVPYLSAQNDSNHGVLLEGTSSSINYGNSNFGFLRVAGSNTSPYAGLKLNGTVAYRPINLINFNNVQCVQGYYGLYTSNACYNTIGLLDAEYIVKPLYFDGAADGFDSLGNNILSGYLLAQGTGATNITATLYAGGNSVKSYVDGLGDIISDIQQFRVCNSYDLVLGSSLSISDFSILKYTHTPLRIEQNGSGDIVINNPKSGGRLISDSGYVGVATFQDYDEYIFFDNVDATELPSPFNDGNMAEGRELVFTNLDDTKTVIVGEFQGYLHNGPHNLLPETSVRLKVFNEQWYVIS